MDKKVPIGIINSTKDIGKAIRAKRKSDGLTQVDAAAEQQSIWEDVAIIGRILEVIVNQVRQWDFDEIILMP